MIRVQSTKALLSLLPSRTVCHRFSRFSALQYSSIANTNIQPKTQRGDLPGIAQGTTHTMTPSAAQNGGFIPDNEFEQANPGMTPRSSSPFLPLFQLAICFLWLSLSDLPRPVQIPPWSTHQRSPETGPSQKCSPYSPQTRHNNTRPHPFLTSTCSSGSRRPSARAGGGSASAGGSRSRITCTGWP